MGGLDARYMIARLGMAARVLTLTTLAPPTRAPLRRLGIARFARLVKPILKLFRIPTQGFYDLTTASCREFNREVGDAPGVRYFSVAGQHEGGYFNPEWYLPHGIVHKAEGPNDGVVSVPPRRMARASRSGRATISVW